jgi:Glycosyltransferase family 87
MAAMLSDRLRPTRTPGFLAGCALAVVLWVVAVAFSDPAVDAREPFEALVTAQDARSYYGLDLADLYAGRTDWNTIGAYPYSPAFAQLVYPLDLLPWTAFVGAWTALLILAVYYLTGPDLFLPGLVVGAMEILGGNVSLLLAAAIVAGFRHPWTWAFVLLTKITPGVGLLWFVLRRQWRKLAIALGATLVIVVASAVLMPHNWRAWLELLASNTGKGGTWAAIPIPLWLRGPAGVALIAWGALRNQRWTVPVGAMLALPALWYGSLSMLLAVIPLTTAAQRAGAWARVRGRFGRPTRSTPAA